MQQQVPKSLNKNFYNFKILKKTCPTAKAAAKWTSLPEVEPDFDAKTFKESNNP